MNGVHDMGGMHGLGPLEIEADEPVFHAPWEARVLALTLAVGAWGRWNIDASRHARERIPGPAYLAMNYYEKWLAGLTTLIEAAGLMRGGTKFLHPATPRSRRRAGGASQGRPGDPKRRRSSHPVQGRR